MTDQCKWCGRFKAKFCILCEGTQSTLEGDPISDSHSQVSVTADRPKYECHKCSKRARCTIRRPIKAHYGDWEGRLRCEYYEKDEKWWQ